MPRKGHSEEQIVYALRQADAGKKVGDICRDYQALELVARVEQRCCRSIEIVVDPLTD